jgi:ABC-type Fe3+-siderophore transport system permease subunit
MNTVVQVLWSKLTFSTCNVDEIYQTVVWDIRMPRAILGALVGGCLAVSGAAFQGLFRNPWSAQEFWELPPGLDLVQPWLSYFSALPPYLPFCFCFWWNGGHVHAI